MNEFESLGFFDFEDFVTEMTDEQLIAVNGGACAGGGAVTPSYTPHSWGTCSGGGAVTPSNPVPVPSTSCGGGYNSSNQGSFSYITNEAARKARMQDYEGTDLDKMNGNMLFSKKGCKMMGFAKILSQITGFFFSIQDINKNYDSGKDGLISKEEIGDGIRKNLANNKSVTVDYWEKTLSKETLNSITRKSGKTYMLGRAENVAGGDHWIVLEGYSTNSNGQVEFTYNPTSKNDTGRKFILGDPTPQQKANNYYKINKIETFTVN